MELFVERGFAETTTLEIASRARVSKRELYALVGNKDEMLAVCVARRGDRMRLPEGFPEATDRARLEAALKEYGATMLRELTDPAVLEVFRLGIAEAKRSPTIAHSLNERGRGPARSALEALLKAARAANLLADGSMEEMLHDFHGLLWGNAMVWILLGLEKAPGPKEIEQRAGKAARSFLELYGTASCNANARPSRHAPSNASSFKKPRSKS
jgi:AcrR family transcriptional regulator